MTDSESARGVSIGAGGGGTVLFVRTRGGTETGARDTVVGSCEASNDAAGDSTCCVVVWKYRARFGSRKVGGRAEEGIPVSRRDLLIVLLSILRLSKMPALLMLRRASDIESF